MAAKASQCEHQSVQWNQLSCNVERFFIYIIVNGERLSDQLFDERKKNQKKNENSSNIANKLNCIQSPIKYLCS